LIELKFYASSPAVFGRRSCHAANETTTATIRQKQSKMLYNAPGLFFDDKSDRNAQELLKLLKLNLTIAHVVVTSIIAEYFDNIN